MFDMPTYLMDVVEQMGDDVARRCYWDWGPWSDLTRLWRPVDIPKQHGTYVTFKVGLWIRYRVIATDLCDGQ